MKRIKLIVQFLGTNYCGWQVQPNQPTVQGTIQDAILQALGENVVVNSSGRTDAGVHAVAMPMHFDTNTRIQPSNIYRAINAYLPEDIVVLSSEQVGDEWNARFDVKSKTYIYRFYTNENVLPYYDITETRINTDFDYDRAKSACEHFVGTHDWRGFCSANTKVASTVRTISKISLKSSGIHYTLSVTGDGFLYNMVRIIAGTIIEIGQGKIALADLPKIIASGERNRAGRTAPARGLALFDVKY